MRIVGWMLMVVGFLVLLAAAVTAAGAPDAVQWGTIATTLALSGGLFITGLIVAGLGKLVALAQEQVDLLHDMLDRRLPAHEVAVEPEAAYEEQQPEEAVAEPLPPPGRRREPRIEVLPPLAG
ncbi:hypothetical protein HUS23_06050 [Ectothiorhodospiraceae bacterium 2226]|nr:hypothetical protein HUS23_06050 [Ectothiorhodospiraceae bacterium 2226]